MAGHGPTVVVRMLYIYARELLLRDSDLVVLCSTYNGKEKTDQKVRIKEREGVRVPVT